MKNHQRGTVIEKPGPALEKRPDAIMFPLPVKLRDREGVDQGHSASLMGWDKTRVSLGSGGGGGGGRFWGGYVSPFKKQTLALQGQRDRAGIPPVRQSTTEGSCSLRPCSSPAL